MMGKCRIQRIHPDVRCFLGLFPIAFETVLIQNQVYWVAERKYRSLDAEDESVSERGQHEVLLENYSKESKELEPPDEQLVVDW